MGAYILLALLSVAGCASHPKPASQPDEAMTQPATQHYQSAAASSLVFDPPVTVGQPPLALSRDDRTPGAFVGYDSLITTYFYIRTDDRTSSDFTDRYERRAVSEKVGVTYR